jgi:hypothetical protein
MNKILLDRICRKFTAFPTFSDLLAAKGNYRPSLNVSDSCLRRLADDYDKAQEFLGDPRRAFRFS